MLYVIGLERGGRPSSADAVEHWMWQNFVDHRHVLPQLWIAESTLAADQIRTGLDPLLGADYHLVVIKTAHEAVTRHLPEATVNWIRTQFPDSLTDRIPP